MRAFASSSSDLAYTLAPHAPRTLATIRWRLCFGGRLIGIRSRSPVEIAAYVEVDQKTGSSPTDPLRPLRSRHERPTTARLTQMAAGDTTVDTGGEFVRAVGNRDFPFCRSAHPAQTLARRPPTGIRHQCHCWVYPNHQGDLNRRFTTLSCAQPHAPSRGTYCLPLGDWAIIIVLPFRWR